MDLLRAMEVARRQHRDIHLLVVGTGELLEEARQFAESLSLPVTFAGFLNQTEITRAYAAADCLVLPSDYVGITYPCKIYNILSIGAPALYIGPAKSHITDIFSQMGEDGFTRSAAHGDVEAVTRHILDGVASSDRVLNGRVKVPGAIAFSKQAVLPRLIEALQPVCDSSAHYDSSVADSKAHSL